MHSHLFVSLPSYPFRLVDDGGVVVGDGNGGRDRGGWWGWTVVVDVELRKFPSSAVTCAM